MAGVLTVEVKGLKELNAKFGTISKTVGDAIDKALTKGAMRIATNAKKRAPKDRGGLASSISADTSTYLDKRVGANVFYAAFIEFGTGKHAAQYVATLPADWKTYAATFKKSGDGGTFDDMVQEIYDWIRRNKIGYTYNIQTRKRDRVGKQTGKTTDMASAYYIAKMILLNGIKPQPFFYPAFNDEKPKVEAEVVKIINTLLQ